MRRLESNNWSSCYSPKFLKLFLEFIPISVYLKNKRRTLSRAAFEKCYGVKLLVSSCLSINLFRFDGDLDLLQSCLL